MDIDAFAEIIEDGSVEWMRRQAVDSNRRPWNGIDYTDFTIENGRKGRRHYLASVKHLDDQIGLILTCLEETGLVENTIVLLTSDHGDFLGDRGLVGKKYFFRQAVDVPLIMAGPGVTPGTDQTLRSLSDLFATVLDAAGVDESDLSDSRSLLAEGDVNRVVCGQLDIGLFCARENWRYSRYRGGEIRLYNITRDPEELINLAERDEACRTRSEMESALTEWMSESLYAAHRDKRVEARNDDPDSEFNRAGWVRPYPGRS